MKREEIDKKQLEQLKEAARVFLKPIEKMPFSVVVEAMTGYELIPYTEENDKKLIDDISISCMQTIGDSERSPIIANRPNDVSAQVEKILQKNLIKNKIVAEQPRSAIKKSVSPQGYPDLLLWCEKRPTYLEVKVSRVENIGKGSARNFFYQPTKNSKITRHARHLLCGFSMFEISEKKWVLKEWKITDLWFLRVKLKPEYNANNLEIYRRDAILAEGDGEKTISRP